MSRWSIRKLLATIRSTSERRIFQRTKSTSIPYPVCTYGRWICQSTIRAAVLWTESNSTSTRFAAHYHHLPFHIHLQRTQQRRSILYEKLICTLAPIFMPRIATLSSSCQTILTVLATSHAWPRSRTASFSTSGSSTSS
jgi:hypothetical protein